MVVILGPRDKTHIQQACSVRVFTDQVIPQPTFSLLSVCAPHVCLVSKQGTEFPKLDGLGCEAPCRHWEPNSGPLQENHVLLTTKRSLLTISFLKSLN